MNDNAIEPQQVIQLVEDYVRKELDSAERYENSTPLDSSGVWSLHQLARDVYALGVKDGTQQEAARGRGERQWERDRQREAESARAQQIDMEENRE